MEKSNKGIMNGKQLDSLCKAGNSVGQVGNSLRLLIGDIKADDYSMAGVIEVLSYCEKELSRANDELDKMSRTHSRLLFERECNLDIRALISMQREGIITENEYRQALNR